MTTRAKDEARWAGIKVANKEADGDVTRSGEETNRLLVR